jgi:hypothetical protein
MPCGFFVDFFERTTPVIVSMAAQKAAMAMTGIMKRICDFPPPDGLQAPAAHYS